MKRLTGAPQPLGAVRKNKQVNFAVAVPVGSKCELLLYKKGTKKPAKILEMKEKDGIGSVRFLAIEELPEDMCEYNYRIDGEIVSDLYSKALIRPDGFGSPLHMETHEVRNCVVQNHYDWEGDELLGHPFYEVIAYSLHVRGFTKHVSSGVKAPGTFKGVIEKIPYLKDLGINQIQCMPVYEFDEVVNKKKNYWGYGEGLFFAPKSTYSASGDAVTELKDMVKACHRAGIEVVLEMPFAEGILPQKAIACLIYYRTEFHVDGFVINPYTVAWDAVKKEPMLSGMKIIKKEEGFQNVMRRFLKGEEGMTKDVMWALMRHTGAEGIYNSITGHTGFTLCDLVSYNEKHNMENGEMNQDGPNENYSWNCGEEGVTSDKKVLSLRKQQMKNAWVLLLLAQGTPCILAGDEFGNTQMGNNNVYCQDNEVSWLNWELDKDAKEILDFVKRLIVLRKKYAFFHRGKSFTGRDNRGFGVPDVSFHGEVAWRVTEDMTAAPLSVMYSDAEAQTACLIMYNMHWKEQNFALPGLPHRMLWQQIFSTTVFYEEEQEEVENIEGLNDEMKESKTTENGQINNRTDEQSLSTEKKKKHQKKEWPQIKTVEPSMMRVPARSIVVLLGTCAEML